MGPGSQAACNQSCELCESSHSRSLEIAPVDRSHRLVINFLPQRCPIFLPHLYRAPPLGITPLDFQQTLWRQQTRFPVLLSNVDHFMIGFTGVATGLYRYIYTLPKSLPENCFVQPTTSGCQYRPIGLWYCAVKIYTPQNKFLATPLIGLVVLTQYQHVIDRRTDRRTEYR